jgi:uncharacterized protein
MIRLIAFILAATALFTPASAQEIPAACTGKNLLAELQINNPAEAEKVLQETAQIPNQGPLLWKVTSRKSKKPSWLMGTMHVTDTRITTLTPAVEGKIRSARVMVLELKEIANKQQLAMKIKSFTSALNMPPGKTVWDVIPDDQEKAVRANPTIAMMPAAQIEHLQPWVLIQSLSAPFCEQLRQPFKKSLDEILAHRALDAGVPVLGLEEVAEQVRVMSSVSMTEQVEALIAAASRKTSAEDLYITMVEMYLNRQVSALMPLYARLPEDKNERLQKTNDRFMTALLDKRNLVMAKRARQHLDKGNAFIAVGALHLAGETGLVQLLRKAGYKVTPAE